MARNKLADVVSHETPPAPSIEMWALDRLKPYARNSRTHSPEQVAKIVASIRQFGFTTPILAQEDGTIIAGHGRLQAASRLKLERVPVIVARGWTPAQVKAYVITDNKVALDAGWDEEMLKLELGDLAEMGFDMTATGFGEDELDVLFGRVADDVDRDEPEIKPQYQILIECETEADQLRLLEQFQSENVNARALIS